ncbi:MAG: hypothetical protein ACPGO5_01455 [Patescibacteria group bacterium]
MKKDKELKPISTDYCLKSPNKKHSFRITKEKRLVCRHCGGDGGASSCAKKSKGFM